jgi:hypothetical protein
VAFLLKVGWESATGGGVFVHGSDAGFVAVPLAHVTGAAVGFVVGAAGSFSGGSRKTLPMPPLRYGGKAAARSAGPRSASSGPGAESFRYTPGSGASGSVGGRPRVA